MSLTFFDPGHVASGFAKLIYTSWQNTADIVKELREERPSSNQNFELLKAETFQLSKKHFEALARCRAEPLMEAIRRLRQFSDDDRSGYPDQKFQNELATYLGRAVRKYDDFPLLLDLFFNPATGTALSELRVENFIFAGQPSFPASLCQFAASVIDYYEETRPYFKIYPDYAEMFRNTRLNVPAEAFVLPYPVFDILFSVESPVQVNGCPVFGFQVVAVEANGEYWNHRSADSDRSQYRLACIVYADMVINWLGAKIFAGNRFIEKMSPRERAFSLPFFVDIDVDPTVKDLETSLVKRMTEVSALLTKPLPGYEYATEKRELYGEIRERIKKDVGAVSDLCARIILSVSFLHRGFDADLLEPDFLSKDLQPYMDAIQKKDEKKIQALQEKADRVRGKKGVAIGKSDYLLGKRYIVRDVKEDECVDENQEKPESSRELKYCHLRNPHFRMMRVGKGRTEFRSKFIRQVIVRKDLPPKPNSGQVGFSTPKEKK